MNLRVDKLWFQKGQLQYELGCSEDEMPALETYEVYLYNETTGKKVKNFKKVENADVSIRVEFENGTIETLSALDTVYQTLDSTFFNAKRNIHIQAKKSEQGYLLIGAWKTNSQRIKKRPYYLSDLSVEGNRILFSGQKKNILDAKIVLWSKLKKAAIELPLSREMLAKGIFSIDTQPFKEDIVVGSVRWDVMLIYRDQNMNYNICRVEHEKNRYRIRRRSNPLVFRFPKNGKHGKWQENRFLETIPVDTLYSTGEKMELSPNYTLDWQLSLQGILVSRRYMRSFTEQLLSVSLTEETLVVKIRCKNRGMNIKGLSIVLREDLTVRHALTLCKEKRNKRSTTYTFTLNIKEVEWQPINYNFVVEEEKDGVDYDIRPINLSYWFWRKFYSLRWKSTQEMGDYILILMVMKSGNVHIRYRERLVYDDIMYRKRERIARVLYLLGKPVLDHMGMILLFERFSTAAQDNGVHMFEYYMKQNRKHVYYVMRSDMPDYHKVEKYGKHVLEFMSLKHMIYIQAAKVLVSTDTKRHGYQWLGPNSQVYNKMFTKPIVFLQHGVLAMKTVSSIYDRYRSNAADLFITSSEIEKQIVNQSFRYEQSRIAVTGLARWDVLFDKSNETKEKEILFIPTWRGWMDGIQKEDFLKTDYYKVYKQLLESKRLDEMLKKHNMKMIFCMHHKFREFVGEFPEVSERIQLFDFGDTPINELIMRSSFLVTDYSSVAWDSYYLEKPCIFYQFDYDQYMELQGSYFDMERELFGVRVTAEKALLDEMESCIESGFKEKEEYAKLRQEYIPYRDHKHAKRIDEAIKKMHFHGKTEVL